MKKLDRRSIATVVLAVFVAAGMLLTLSCGYLTSGSAGGGTGPVAAPPAPREPAEASQDAGFRGSKDGQQPVLSFVLAEDRDDRLQRAEELCRHQQAFVDRGADDPTEQAALSWLADFLDPRDERARARTRLGPRSGLRDVHHAPGMELYVEAAGGLLLFGSDGVLIGRIGRESGQLQDLDFHDVDRDGQQEIFLAFDSGANSGNRYTEVLGFKEVGGVLRSVLDRRVYETADRWVPDGLGPRLSTVTLAGETYVVLREGADSEFLRWDPARSEMVVESAPARRAFLD